jgi:hypothetical protein
MIRLQQGSTIYVVCPSHFVTGGVEAIHQLVDKLRKFGHDARIVAMPRVGNPCLIQYRNYNVRFADAIADESRNLLITTEVNTQILSGFHLIQKAIWWLSVDNHFSLPERFDFSDPGNAQIIHLAQSAYAEQFLRRHGALETHRVTDYLHAEYLRPVQCAKSDIILYTPVKGSQAYVDRLQSIDSSLKWKPLKGMVRKLHAQALRQGNVYVDFGSHPGKDRQPREAAVNGCCVVVGLRGSACLKDDLPISGGYKFDLEAFDAERIVATVRSCLASYQARYGDFVDYADLIRGEESRFEQEVLRFAGGLLPTRSRPRGAVILANILCYWRQNSVFVAIRGLANASWAPGASLRSIKRADSRVLQSKSSGLRILSA